MVSLDAQMPSVFLKSNLLLNIMHNLSGRIRNTPEPADELDDDSCVLSLGLFPGEVLEVPGDDRYSPNSPAKTIV